MIYPLQINDRVQIVGLNKNSIGYDIGTVLHVGRDYAKVSWDLAKEAYSEPLEKLKFSGDIPFHTFMSIAERWKPSNERRGQHYFNILYFIRPEMAVMPMYADPFYDDEKLKEFFNWLQENW